MDKGMEPGEIPPGREGRRQEQALCAGRGRLCLMHTAAISTICAFRSPTCSNLRCRYCMPDGVPKLAHEDILTYEEFLRLAALFAQCGIDTVRITGGEPLVRRGVEQLTAGLKAIPGIRARCPYHQRRAAGLQKLPALLAAGLDSVNISLDTLHPETFRRITGKDELAAVQKRHPGGPLPAAFRSS
ncbi:MAG: radical SAM protein [Faecalibacterium prausnitzii]